MGELKIGDIVQLKSGSPKMTVMQLIKDDIYCIWHDGSDFRNKVFPIATLQKIYIGN
jgi:uncharacterized protein YodC (DUF2158 family)